MSPAVLYYHRDDFVHGPGWPLKMSWYLAGAVAYASATVLIFAATVYFHFPELLSLYPICFALAVVASSAEKGITRLLGRGAVIGSVFMSTIVYGICLMIMRAM